MILSHGYDEYEAGREKVIHYKFFDDPIDHGRDAIYGLDPQLMKIVNLFTWQRLEPAM